MNLAVLAVLAVSAAAQSTVPLKVTPGDTVTMPIIVRNIDESNNAIHEVKITTSVTSSAIVTEPGSFLGPSDIGIGASANFTWTVKIETSAVSGVYRATSRAISSSPDVVAAGGFDQSTQILLVHRDSVSPTAKIMFEGSSGSVSGPDAGSAQVLVEFKDNEALDRVELWLDGVVVSTHVLEGKSTQHTFAISVNAPQLQVLRYMLKIFDKAGNVGVEEFQLAMWSWGIGTNIPLVTGAGVHGSPLTDHGGGVSRLLATRVNGDWIGGGGGPQGNAEGIYVDGAPFPEVTQFGSVSCEYGTGDTPDGLTYTNIGQADIFIKTLTFETYSTGSAGGMPPWGRFHATRATLSVMGMVPYQVVMQCDDGSEFCENPTPHYMYHSAGSIYPSSIGCGQNYDAIRLSIDKNTEVGRFRSVATDFAAVDFDSVTYSGRTSVYMTPDSEPTGGTILLETSAYVSGPSRSTFNILGLIPPGVSQSRLNALTVETVSGAAATLVPIEASEMGGGIQSISLELPLGNSPMTGVIGEYRIVIPPNTTPLGAPTNLTAQKQPDGSVKLSFTAPIDNGYSGQADHLILEIERNGAPHRFIAIPANPGGTQQQYTSESLQPGNYRFKLRGVDENGSSSADATASANFPIDYPGGGFVGDQRQASLSAGQAFAVNSLGQSDARLAAFGQAASNSQVVPLGDVLEVVSPETVLSGPAELTVRISSADAIARGIDPVSLTLVRLSSDTLVSVVQNLGADSVMVDITTVTAEIYAIVGAVSIYPDTSAPLSQLSYSSDAIQGSDGIVLAYPTTLFTITAADPSIVGSSTTGVSAIVYYLDVPTFGDPLDILASTTYAPITYSGPFSIDPGTHTIGYFSADGNGNMEQLKFATVSIQGQTDHMPPRSTFIAGNPSASIGSTTMTYISSASLLGFSVSDDKSEVNDGLGVGATQTFYALDGGTFERFTSSFSLVVEGAHSLSFFSIDVVGNEEAPIQKSIFVDLTSPVTQLNQNGAEIALDAFDPSIAGGASGVARIRYLVDYGNPEVCNNIAEDPNAPRGTCENPWYDGPFSLPSGEHPIHFQAFDNVGNVETLQTVFANVESSNGGSDVGGLGIGRDPLDTLWTVSADTESISFAHADSFGALISSATLQDAADGLPWSVFFNNAGRAYAIGMAEGAGTQALDLAIYKASPSGDAIESRTLFDSGYALNELVFDAKAPGWIVGAAQAAGPADFDAEGDRSFSLALWRFDPALGTVQLSTSTTRAGFDFASGLAVDADGSLWVVGYSLHPDDPEVGALDLALRHYAADGQTMLGGPYFMPGYLDHFDGPVNAKVHVTADAVYVAAPRRNDSAGFDAAFLKFDKATGAPLVEKIWRAEGGAPSYPIAILPEAAGLLIAGGIGAETTEAGLWRFGYDGAFLGAATAGAGGAKGAVFMGSELWLSVEGSTAPYRVMSEAPAAGTVIDISTPSGSGGFTVSTTTGPIGIPFTIAGEGFGPYSGGNTKVMFGGLSAPLSLWNDTTIKGTVPGLSTGAYAVTIERQNVSSLTVISAGFFTVTDLNNAALNISSGPIGVPFSIAGSGFGPYAGALSRVLLGGATAPLSVWNDTTISGTLPAAAPGETTIVIERATTDGGLSRSDGFAFEVTVPSVTSVSPSSGPIGAVYSLTGFSFGPYAGANTRVLIGGATTSLSLWSDRIIKGTVPGGLMPGMQSVIVERRTSGGGLVQSGTAYFQVAGLALETLTPSSAPIGVPFTISGSGFGAFDGANTRVKFGVSTAALSLWNDTTITGTIPALETGEWAVVIERQQGSAVSASATATFTATALSVSAISPSSGPIGTSFTLMGPGFGPYAGAASVVLIDGATAALSVWNDAQIVGTIPGSAQTGSRPVVLRRTSGSGESVSTPVYFEVTGPAVAGIFPSSAPIGAPFTITGSQFGAYGGANTRVSFGGVLAPLSLWNDTTITGTVPALSTGVVEVVVERQQGEDVVMSSISTFTVAELAPSALTPETGPIGTVFTITGTGFGPYAGANSRVLIGGATAALSLWNDTTITGTIPHLPTGAHPVWLERSAGDGVSSSATSYFNVTTPAVATLTPSSAPIGAPFTITGTSFGAYAGANTRVTFNGVIAALSLWNDTTITGTVPALPAGVVDLIVERQQGAGVAASAAVPFTVLDPAVAGVSPGSGPIGTVFTITGSGFGPYAGANSRVLIGGATATLSLWNDTTIKGTIPSLPAGVQPVWLERSAGDGVSSSATSYFTVTTPEVAALTPSSAPIGAPFAITGTSFGAYAGADTRVTFNGVVAPLSVWNDTEIKGTVPGALPPGEAVLVVERAAGTGLTVSATQAFLVLVPSISTVSPAYGYEGTVVTVEGSGFGPYSGSLTKLLVGGATVPLSVWNDTTIRWTVPASLGHGEHAVVVVRSPAGGTVQSSSATFTVGTPYSGSESLTFSTTLSLAETPDTHFEGEMSLSSATGGRIDTPAKAAVDIPPNAMEEDTAITLKRLRGDGRRDDAAQEINLRAAGEPIEFGPAGTRFAAPVTIELPYDPALVEDETKIAVHYYNPLRREWEALASVVDRARRVVTAKTDHFSIYQPLGLAPTTVAQDEFYFRDVYAFPNPSRGGAAVTFRIQPGLAETIELRVYDLSGRRIHSSSDFTFRGAIDDGNGKGAQNTYDHVWNVGGVGSRVYNYVIKASQRGHKPMNKTGKVGVIR